MENEHNITLATELTVAWLSNQNTRVSSEDVPAFLRSMYEAIRNLDEPVSAEPVSVTPTYEPAVSVRKSLASKDHLISLIDGRPYKTLRRHLSGHGLTPDEYRSRYGLKPDYPMVAESYSEARRDMAKKIGLGRKPGEKVVNVAKAVGTKAKRGSKAALDAAKQALGTDD
ncbi:MAG: MucR family transcriptional regulator [Sphingomonas phyllosphaerae]